VLYCTDVGNSASTSACLRIETDGTAVYYPLRQPTQDAACEPNYYVMRHTSDVVVETLDDVGCHYVVTRTGENHVGRYTPAARYFECCE